MIKNAFLLTLLLAVIAKASGQAPDTVATGVLATDLKNLIALNTGKEAIKDVINLSGKEYINISSHASRQQEIVITAPYMSSKDPVVKDICLSVSDGYKLAVSRRGYGLLPGDVPGAMHLRHAEKLSLYRCGGAQPAAVAGLAEGDYTI